MAGYPEGIEIDCAFGGMWYVIVDADKIGIQIRPQDAAKIAKIGEEIKACIFLFISIKIEFFTTLHETF